jgi:hypothetical protein
MINSILLYIGAGLTAVWGIAHLFPTRSVVTGFGAISTANKHIITMEWIVEGVSLILVGVLVSVVTLIDPSVAVSKAVYLICGAGLLALAVVSLFTGFKVDFIPFKLCPLIFTLSAAFILVGGFM